MFKLLSEGKPMLPFWPFVDFIFSYKINNPYSEDFCPFQCLENKKIENKEKINYNKNEVMGKGETDESININN